MKKKTVIGIIGEQAGGKGAVADIIIKKFGGTRLTVSTILRRTLDSLYIPSSRANLINLALILKKSFSSSILMDAMLKEVEKVDSDLTIVDGIRMPGDTKPFLKEYGDSFRLIYVTADAKIRYKRSVKRGEKAGESEQTFKDFLAKEKFETEASIAKVGANADFKIENNGDTLELEKRIEEIMTRI